MSTTESWAFIKDGRIFWHIENDGPAVVRRGLEAEDREIGLGELAARYPREFENLVKAEIRAYYNPTVTIPPKKPLASPRPRYSPVWPSDKVPRS